MISIFAKRAFYNVNPSEEYDKRTKPPRGHLQRVSSIIRADQIAEAVGAKLNPVSGYENDVCIYVKPRVAKDGDFKFEGRKKYLDIIDGHNLGQLALKNPDLKVIVCSQADWDTMRGVIPNQLVLIPQHHCNFKREHRNAKEIKRVGVIGELPAFEYLPVFLKEQLKRRDIELVKFSKFFSREDIVKFYMSIDLQLVWRPYKKLLSNPLKIVNAASFGVPTIALEEPAFGEVEGCYIPVKSLEEILASVDNFIKNHNLYNEMSLRSIDKSEKYHITNIAKLYKELDS